MNKNTRQALYGAMMAGFIFFVMWTLRFQPVGATDNACFVVNRWTGVFYLVSGAGVYPLSKIERR